MKKGEFVTQEQLYKSGFVFFYSYKTVEIYKKGNYRIVIELATQKIMGIFEIVPGGGSYEKEPS